MYIHLTLVPYIGHAGELKTKPTQHSVNELRRIGIQPDMLLCRSEGELGDDIRKKIALFASLGHESVVSAKDVDNIYKVPLWYHAPGRRRLHHRPLRARGRARRPRRVARDHRARRRRRRSRCASRSSASTSQLEDAYLSVSEALRHSGFLHGGKIEIDWVDSETLDTDEEAAGAAGRRGRHPRPRRLRRPRHRGQDPRRPGRARAQDPVPGHLPGHARRGERVRAQRRRHAGRELDRVRHRDRVPGDRPAARAEGGHRPRRHDAPRRRPDQAAPRHARARALRRGGRLRAPPPPLRGVDLAAQAPGGRRASSSRARRPTSAWSRSSSCATTRSSSPRSSTPSSSRARSARRRSSASSSPPRWSARAAAPPRAARCAPRAAV